MTRRQAAGWLLALALGAAIGVLAAIREDRPKPRPRRPTFDPEIGWTTTTDPDGW